ncbi:MAG TPA: hypothetical protein VMZ26_17375 [Pyrinomonadaceae bacterium]|nr:hypothetical protein [Pyrinomonadaceae bacterium]
MKTIARNVGTTALLLFVLLAVEASAQKTSDPAENFYNMTKAAPAAFNKGEFAGAKSAAEALLVEAELYPKSWNYGNAIHVANLVLGRVALAEGRVKEAREFLLAAGKTPGSPQLNSFGPDMAFAKDMLQKGESEAVIEYLDLCAKFWNEKHSHVAEWKTQIANGETPAFGPNLRYFF